MDFNTIIYAALGGGLGGLMGGYLASRADNQFLKIISIIPAIIGWQVASFLYENMTLPRIVPINETEIFTEMPALKVVKENDPDTFSRMMNEIDPVMRSGRLTAETLTPFRNELIAYMNARTPYAEPSILRELFANAVTQYEELEIAEPSVCTDQAHGRPFQALDKILSKQVAAEEQKVMEKLFAVKIEGDKGDIAKGEEIYNTIIGEQVKQLEITNADPSVDDIQGNKKMCFLLINLNKHIIELNNENIRHVAAYTTAVVTN